LKDLYAKNTELKAKIGIKNSALWFTLIGLKLLSQYFEDSRKMWKLVAKKARKALKELIGFTGDIDEALSTLNIEIDN
jgi:hypothetical protein